MPSGRELYKTRKGKAGGVVVAIHLSTKASHTPPRQEWQGFYWQDKSAPSLCLARVDLSALEVQQINKSNFVVALAMDR